MAKFKDLPLGTRFCFTQGDGMQYAILNRTNCGLVAKWDGVDSKSGQTVFCLVDKPEELQALEVFNCE